jgi:hypothetical protein
MTEILVTGEDDNLKRIIEGLKAISEISKIHIITPEESFDRGYKAFMGKLARNSSIGAHFSIPVFNNPMHHDTSFDDLNKYREAALVLQMSKPRPRHGLIYELGLYNTMWADDWLTNLPIASAKDWEHPIPQPVVKGKPSSLMANLLKRI